MSNLVALLFLAICFFTNNMCSQEDNKMKPLDVLEAFENDHLLFDLVFALEASDDSKRLYYRFSEEPDQVVMQHITAKGNVQNILIGFLDVPWALPTVSLEQPFRLLMKAHTDLV